MEGLGRSSEPALLVLMSLSGGPKHGYAISEDIARFAGRDLGPGTLYGAISRLEERGLIVASPTRDRRKPYELTAAGRSVLEIELGQMTRLAAVAARRLQSRSC